MGNSIWGPDESLLQNPHRSHMGCPYRTHIITHLGPIWVPYSLLAGYVVPRLIYGLEVHNMRKKDLQQPETATSLTSQGLPIRASDTASLALLGMLPVGAGVEKNALTLF